MRKKFPAIIAAFVIAIAAAVQCSSISPDSVEIAILHFNDLGGRVTENRYGEGGIAKLAAAIAEQRLQYKNAILLSAGDMITGDVLSTLTKGEGIMRLANLLKIDAFVPGNHEFDYGVDQYLKLMNIADFPFVAANIDYCDKSKKPEIVDAKYIVKDVGGVKIGIIGIANPATQWLTAGENNGVEFADAIDSAKKVVREIDKKAQIVVALTHIGTEEDRKLAQSVPEIDVIIGGHSHEATFSPIHINGCLIVSAGENGKYLGILKIKIDQKSMKYAKISGELIEVGRKITPAPNMKTAVFNEESKLDIKPDEMICKTKRRLDREKDLCPWIASLIKKYSGADVGLVNIGGIRESFETGVITYRDVFRVMPFDDQVAVVILSGAELERLLSKDNMITDRKINLIDGKIYRVATSDFIAKIHKFPPKNVRILPMKIRDLMIDDLKNRETLP